MRKYLTNLLFCGVVIISCLFLSCTVCISSWILLGEVFHYLLPSANFGILSPFLAVGSVRVSENLNLSNLAFAFVYSALLLLLIVADGLLENVVESLRQSAKLPSLSVVAHYQNTNYATALRLAGTAEKWKKPLRQNPQRNK